MATNTYGDVTHEVAAEISAMMLKRGQDLMILERFGQYDPQPKNKGKTRTWRRYESLNPSLAPLADGVTPAAQQLTFTDYTAVLEQHGGWVKITDQVEMLAHDPVMEQATELCGEAAAEVKESLRWNVLKAGTNVFYAGGAASRTAVLSPPSRSDIRKIIRAFNRTKGKRLTKIIRASAMTAVEPIAPSYIGLCHTDLEADIRGMTGFVDPKNYADASKQFPGEIGSVEGVRFIGNRLFDPWLAASTDNSTNTTYLTSGVQGTGSPDVYPIVILAENAYGLVPLSGEDAITPKVKRAGEPSSDDPLGQKGFVSWKFMDATAILNHNWIARLECCATANPA